MTTTMVDRDSATMQVTCGYCEDEVIIRPNDLFKYLPYTYSFTCPNCYAANQITSRELSPEFKKLLK